MKIKVFVILLCFISFAFGQWDFYAKYAMYKAVSAFLVPMKDLQLLVDPAATLGTGTGNVAPSITLGSNLIDNGDFHDFTMEDDVNSIGHYIFDDTYVAEDGLVSICSERSGSETLLTTNGDFSNGLTGWTAIGTPTIFEVRSGRAYIDGDGSDGFRQLKSSTIGKTYRMKADVECITGEVICNLHAGVETPKYVTAGNTETIEVYSVATVTNVFAWFYCKSQASTFYIDNVSIHELPDNSLIPENFSNNFTDELGGSNPVYQGGNALEFNGVDQHLNGGDIHDFGTGDFTIEAWVKTTMTTAGMIISKYYTSNPRWHLNLMATTGYVNFRLRTTSGDGIITSITSVTDGDWHHIAVVVDRDVGAYIYIDGVIDTTEETTEWTNLSAEDITNGVTDFMIGSRHDSPVYFDGYIAEVRVSDNARSAVEIQESAGQGKGWVNTGNVGTWEVFNDDFAQNFKRGGSYGPNLRYHHAVESGELYKISFDVVSWSGVKPSFGIYTNSNSLKIEFDQVNVGNHYGYFQAHASENYYFRVSLIGTGNATVDNVKVQKVTNIDGTIYPFVEDFSLGGAKYGSEISTGTLTLDNMYLITATELNHFGVGLIVGDYFVSAGTETCDANNKVKQVINGNHGLMQNSMEDDQPTHPYALEFNGVDQFIDHGDVCDVGTDDFMAFAWFKGGNTTEIIFSKYEDTPLTGFWLKNNTEYLQGYLRNTAAAYVEGTTLINDNDWHFTCLIKTSTTLKVYLDGVDDTNTQTGVPNLNYDNDGSLKIGAYRTIAENFWTGKLAIAGLYIFPGGLPSNYEAAIIQTIYNNTKEFYEDE